MFRTTASKFLGFIVSCMCFIGNLSSHANTVTDTNGLLVEQEAKLVEVVDHIVNGQTLLAMDKLEGLLIDQPNFRLANLLYADLMAAKGGRAPTFGKGSRYESKIAQLLEEAKRRYQHSNVDLGHHQDRLPDSLIQVSSSQDRVVVIDTALSRAHVFENRPTGLLLIDDYYATIGENGLVKVAEGDKRTPMGIYFITSRLDPLGLDDLYGDGALPLNYPNEWDQRLGRTGHGIWIHGVPRNTYSRPPFATEGCIALPNDDISRLYHSSGIQDTPVIISPSINWVSAESVDSLRRVLLGNIEQWRTSWADQNVGAHLAFYSSRFLTDSKDYQASIQPEEKISTTLSVATSDISLFKYPATKGLAVATLNVTHWRKEEESSLRIRQYWQLEPDNQWRIIHEGPASYKPEHFKGIPENLVPVMAENN